MTSHYALVWIDHREAKIFDFNSIEVDRMIVRPHNPTWHIHNEAHSMGSANAPLDREFLDRVVDLIEDAKAILITGPANEKSELAAHMTRRHPNLARRISGVETIDHPSDGALVAVARIFFNT